jgi:predicted Zn-ribbon and HTH transcriptional regulator
MEDESCETRALKSRTQRRSYTEAGRAFAVAKIAAAVLRKDRRVVYCKQCSSAFLDGPERCPRCKSVLVAARTLEPIAGEKEKEKVSVCKSDEWKIDRNSEGKTWITFRGQCLILEAWCAKLGIGVDFLNHCISRRRDITSILRGERPCHVSDLPSLDQEPVEEVGDVDRARVKITNKDSGIRRRFRITYLGKSKSASWWARNSSCSYEELVKMMLDGKDVTPLLKERRSPVEPLLPPAEPQSPAPIPEPSPSTPVEPSSSTPVIQAEIVATAALKVVNVDGREPVHISLLRGKLARFDAIQLEIVRRREELATLEGEYSKLSEELKG